MIPVDRRVEQQPARPAGRSTWAPYAVCIALVVVSGVVYGLQTDRWTADTRLQDAAARLKQVPRTIGLWESREVEIPEQQLQIAGAVGHVARVYRRPDGTQVQVMLLCGDHGPISLHPPTVCFTSSGWALKGELQRQDAKSETGERLGRFQVGEFRKRTPTGNQRMRTWWAWNADGRWDAPDNPRMTYAGSGHLYKLYVTTLLPGEPAGEAKTAKAESDACQRFLREFLPALKDAGI